MTATPSSNLGFQNFFQAYLTADITASDTDIPIDSIPSATEGFMVIDPDTPASREIIFFTSKTATKVVCPSVGDGRGQDGTSAATHLSGTLVIIAPVAAYFEAMRTLFTTTPQGWSNLSATVTTVTNNGNRSYTVGLSSDQTALVSAGNRIKTTRTVAAPNRCTSLNGTNQYWVKTSPGKLTFTDDFVIYAWVKISAYPATGWSTIASRHNGTSGFRLYINPSGTVQLAGTNASDSNFSSVYSQQSIPLNTWVHIAAQLDMSAYTATTTTSYIMIDGINVPALVSRGGTNPTALVQAGNLEIGSQNSGTNYLNGKVAQVAIFNAKVTQANILTYISQGLAGTETSLASAYSFNGVATDLNTATPNDLTAMNSALATNADSPFGTQADGTISTTLDYGIVQSISASSMVIQVPEGCTIPTSGGVSVISYSNMKAPYGFPTARKRWTIKTLLRTGQAITSNATYGAFMSGGYKLNVPIGAWKLTHAAGLVYLIVTTEIYYALSSTVLTGMTNAQANAVTPYIISVRTGAAGQSNLPYSIDGDEVLSAATDFIMYTLGATTGSGIAGDVAIAFISAENSYL